jgi:hypothetical protein
MELEILFVGMTIIYDGRKIFLAAPFMVELPEKERARSISRESSTSGDLNH